MLGIAIGCVGMSFHDFCLLTPDEFTAIVHEWQKCEEGKTRGAWERIRTLGAITIQPHVKKTITPKNLLPMPWDSAPEGQKRQAPPSTKERFEEIVRNSLEAKRNGR